MIKFETMIRNKSIIDFDDEDEEKLKKRVDERACPNCGFVDQEPEYDSICSYCGHIK